MLWLALCLPALPLQLAERGLGEALPLAIIEGPPQRPVIAFCNLKAAAAGILPGQKLAPVQPTYADGRRWLTGRLLAEKQAGHGVLFASHDRGLVKAVADRVIDLGAAS